MMPPFISKQPKIAWWNIKQLEIYQVSTQLSICLSVVPLAGFVQANTFRNASIISQQLCSPGSYTLLKSEIVQELLNFVLQLWWDIGGEILVYQRYGLQSLFLHTLHRTI